MVKTIGKSTLLMLLVCMFGVQPKVSVQLNYYDMDGNRLKVAGAGEPFVLECVVQADQQLSVWPEIKGIDRFFFTRGAPQVAMRIVNGVMDMRMTTHYQVRIDTVGTYDIGPASI